MTICSNSATEARRPLVCMLSCNCWSLEIGRAPIRPTAACTFCDWIALMTSAQFKPGGSAPRRYTEDDGTATGVLVGDGYHLIESLFGSPLKTN